MTTVYIAPARVRNIINYCRETDQTESIWDFLRQVRANSNEKCPVIINTDGRAYNELCLIPYREIEGYEKIPSIREYVKKGLFTPADHEEIALLNNCDMHTLLTFLSFQVMDLNTDELTSRNLYIAANVKIQQIRNFANLSNREKINIGALIVNMANINVDQSAEKYYADNEMLNRISDELRPHIDETLKENIQRNALRKSYIKLPIFR